MAEDMKDVSCQRGHSNATLMRWSEALRNKIWTWATTVSGGTQRQGEQTVSCRVACNVVQDFVVKGGIEYTAFHYT
jgi:hypothetical protein